jgi:hypothetical protein
MSICNNLEGHLELLSVRLSLRQESEVKKTLFLKEY